MNASADPLFLSFQLAVAGRYSIDRELGRGGMGIVYLAREVHLDRLVAIKLLPPERAADATLRERFLREARLAAKLSHPNIIPIHAVEDTGEFVFFVMAFVDGETLAQRVRARGPLPASEGTRVLREVAWALAYAHEQGLIHRDVKPDNILLEGSTNRVLVADFGIAAALDDTLDAIAGTPEFMSPEQALGSRLDTRSDLYSLGASAFYAFSGRFPFEGTSATEILARQVTETPPPLASLGATVPRKVASLVDRCLAKDPAHRPPSAQALAEELGVALERRRELPVALRAFVKRTSRINGGGTIAAGLGLLTGSTLVSAWYGGEAGLISFWGVALGAPFAYLISAARRLLLQGFDHADIGPAFKTEVDQAREELSMEHRVGAVTAERWLPLIAKTSGAVSLALWAASSLLPIEGGLGALVPSVMAGYAKTEWLVGTWLLMVSTVTAVVSTVSLLTLRQQHRDIDTEFWAKIWLGRIGKSAFKIARKLLGKRASRVAMTHRATELSLGMAAEQLYESLPKESQRALGDLPAVLARLQQDAQSLRRHYDEMQEALADAGFAAASDEYAGIRETRDAVHAKLGETVGALETIRLNLLRLHAGSATIEGLTTHLGLAAEVSREVERLIAAHEDVERGLRFPRQVETTPV
jgi:eukaryotic-like serine/threonine-protein kinase